MDLELQIRRRLPYSFSTLTRTCNLGCMWKELFPPYSMWKFLLKSFAFFFLIMWLNPLRRNWELFLWGRRQLFLCDFFFFLTEMLCDRLLGAICHIIELYFKSETNHIRLNISMIPEHRYIYLLAREFPLNCKAGVIDSLTQKKCKSKISWEAIK